MSSRDPTFNLTALADRLFREKRLPQLAHAIQRARDLYSLATDLKHALESLDAIDALGDVASDDFRGVITQSALMNNALVLYARATKTTSKERRGFDLATRFSAKQKVVHQELCDLRDRAIAHFGSGGSYRGEWQAELVVLQVKGREARPGLITRRKTLDKLLVQRAREQIEAASAHLAVATTEKFNELSAELDRAADDAPEFFKEVERHPLNLNVFLASPDAADVARASFDQGQAKGAVKH